MSLWEGGAVNMRGELDRIKRAVGRLGEPPEAAAARYWAWADDLYAALSPTHRGGPLADLTPPYPVAPCEVPALLAWFAVGFEPPGDPDERRGLLDPWGRWYGPNLDAARAGEPPPLPTGGPGGAWVWPLPTDPAAVPGFLAAFGRLADGDEWPGCGVRVGVRDNWGVWHVRAARLLGVLDHPEAAGLFPSRERLTAPAPAAWQERHARAEADEAARFPAMWFVQERYREHCGVRPPDPWRTRWAGRPDNPPGGRR